MPYPVKWFENVQTGMPILNGTLGSMINVLDACLVNGFNQSTLESLTLSGTTATATKTAHGFRENDILLIEGAVETEYNGEVKVTNVTNDTFDYTISGTPTSPATGTIAAKVAPLGWTKPYSGTNRAVYKIPDIHSGHFLRVQDDGNLSAGARIAMMHGYETMSDVDNGMGMMPTNVQQSFGSPWRKSGTSDSTGVPWVLVGDDAFFYMFVGWHHSSSTYSSHYAGFCFGDIPSFKEGDSYSTIIVGEYSHISSPSYPGQYLDFARLNTSTGLTTTQAGKYIARHYLQLGASVLIGFTGDYCAGGSTLGSGNIPFPSPIDNGFYIAPVLVNHASVYRGRMPGLYQPLHSNPFNHRDIIANITGLENREIMLIAASQGATEYRCAVDITGPWR